MSHLIIELRDKGKPVEGAEITCSTIRTNQWGQGALELNATLPDGRKINVPVPGKPVVIDVTPLRLIFDAQYVPGHDPMNAPYPGTLSVLRLAPGQAKDTKFMQATALRVPSPALVYIDEGGDPADIPAVKAVWPDALVSVYGIAPHTRYDAREPTPEHRAANDLLRDKANAGDYCAVTCYCYHPGQNNVGSARWMVREAKRLRPQGPIVAFVWDQYHNSGSAPYAPVPDAEMDAMLAMLAEEGAHALLWNAQHGTEPRAKRLASAAVEAMR